MAIANDVLINENFGSASPRTLVTQTLAPFGVEDPARFSVSGDEVELPSHVIPAYVLVLHELATNATKYGALSIDAGIVEIAWVVDNAYLTMTWLEIGGPLVTAPSRTSFGTQLIKRLLVSEAGGTADIAYEPSGIRFTATVPIMTA